MPHTPGTPRYTVPSGNATREENRRVSGDSVATSTGYEENEKGRLSSHEYSMLSRVLSSAESIGLRRGTSSDKHSSCGELLGSFSGDPTITNLRLPIAPDRMKRASDIAREVRRGTEINQVLRRRGRQRRAPRRHASNGEIPIVNRHLVLLYLNFEIDDVMAFAELWRRKTELEELDARPLVIWPVDFATESGLIFEKKQLMASLLGATDVLILPRVPHGEGPICPPGEEEHPRCRELIDRVDDTIAEICDRLTEAEEVDVIHCYISGPLCGNFGRILSRLKSEGMWPMKAKWKIVMYTGSFNTRGLEDSDREALLELVSDSNPLVDISRYHFFGGRGAHPSTKGLSTFCLPSLAREILRRDSLLAASMRIFHDEFNVGLIAPYNDRLFDTPLGDGDKESFKMIADDFEQSKDIKSYAMDLFCNASLLSKVADHKRNCIAAFAHDACEAPLCAQLLFMYDWITKEQPSWLAPQSMQVGQWVADTSKGRTRVDTSAPGGVRAVQPALAEPLDLNVLKRLRRLNEAYFLQHLDELQHGTFGEDGEALLSKPTIHSLDEGTPLEGLTLTTASSVDVLVETPMSNNDLSTPTSSLLVRRRESGDSDLAEEGDDRGLWKSVAEQVKSAVNPDDPDGPDLYDVVSPRFCSMPMYERKVLKLGNKVALRGQRVTLSSCGGPVLLPAMCMRPLQVFAGAVVAVLAFASSHCDNGVLEYPYWIWGPYLLFVVFHLRVEIAIFKHVSIPYIQSVGKWTVLDQEVLGHRCSFKSWFALHILISFTHLSTIGTANIFLGMVTGERIRGICGDERELDNLWRRTLSESLVLGWLTLPFYALPLIVFFIQFLYLVTQMAWVLPGWNQWNTQGINWRYRAPFPQPLEKSVVEYVSPQSGGTSLLGLHRPKGTRFVYYNVARHLMTTGSALDQVCYGCGMGTVQGTANYIDSVARDTVRQIPTGHHGKLTSDGVEKALKSTRKFLQDVTSTMNLRILQLSFHGLLFSGLHLQLQVSYHNLRCHAYPELCHNSVKIWTGIGSSLISSGLMIFVILKAGYMGVTVMKVSQRCMYFVVPQAREFLLQEGAELHPERTEQNINDVIELDKKLIPRLGALAIVSMLLIVNFVWAVSKMIMGQFVCKGHMWNFRLNFEEGCVALDGNLTSVRL